jgi:hypothetical protein
MEMETKKADASEDKQSKTTATYCSPSASSSIAFDRANAVTDISQEKVEAVVCNPASSSHTHLPHRWFSGKNL